MSLLVSAIERDDTAAVASAIADPGFSVNAHLLCVHRPTALVFAAECGCPAIVDLLLSAGAHIDATDDLQLTATHHAAIKGDVPVIEALLAHRPNLALTVDANFTPLQRALTVARNEHLSILLIAAGAPLVRVADRELCNLAASSAHAVHVLMDRGVAVRNLRDNHMCTPLHVAAAQSRRDRTLFNTLVHVVGIDLEARDGWGATCTFMAVQCRNVDALRFFVCAGADVQCRDEIQRTPLHVATQCETVFLLLAAGADVNAQDRSGQTAGHAAGADGLEGLIYAMIAAGADLDLADWNGVTVRAFFPKLVVDADRVEAARRDIAKARLDVVRHRALQVCIGLQSRQLDALQTCEILLHACGPMAPLIAFHHWWAIATTVKHFH